MNLPISNTLTINKLASSFANTSATYKFYWLISIIEMVERGQSTIDKTTLFSRMISSSWYTVNYFHVSFGKQDLIQNSVENILRTENLSIDIKKEKLTTILENSNNVDTQKILKHFNLNVPHWFLSPWFPKLKDENNTNYKKRIYSNSQNFENECPYGLYNEHIIINPIWIDYIKNNAKILKDFCFWNLALFLQARNPNIPDIPNKLTKPIIRNVLTRQTNQYWKLVFKELGFIECIFTGTKLHFEEKNFAIDHFIPHAFVSHDLIWNLIPIEKRKNSSKSNKLPVFEKHFEKFYDLQKVAFEINKQHNSKSRYMDEYLSIFPNIDTFEKEKFSNTIQPLITIASNNGFMFMNNQNSNSHLTAIERTSLSYPARIILNQKKVIGTVLDFGCGIGKDVEILKTKGFDIVGYDPFYFPKFPTKKFDTIFCFYVLNVLLPEEQAEVLMNVSSLLKPTGKAYFAVRRDIQYEGFRIHKIHKKNTYQCLIKLPYLSVFKNQNCEIYEYEHYTTLNKGNSNLSPFLIGEDTRELIVESATAFSFYDKFPVSKGHSLIIPKRYVSNYFDLSLKEQTACWIVVNKVKDILQERFKPHGFNIGVNINSDAGQTIWHSHIHIIPRYKGDVENPRGGIRGVIPNKKEY